jgi:hypothetical protein
MSEVMFTRLNFITFRVGAQIDEVSSGHRSFNPHLLPLPSTYALSSQYSPAGQVDIHAIPMPDPSLSISYVSVPIRVTGFRRRLQLSPEMIGCDRVHACYTTIYIRG